MFAYLFLESLLPRGGEGGHEDVAGAFLNMGLFRSYKLSQRANDHIEKADDNILT